MVFGYWRDRNTFVPIDNYRIGRDGKLEVTTRAPVYRRSRWARIFRSPWHWCKIFYLYRKLSWKVAAKAAWVSVCLLIRK